MIAESLFLIALPVIDRGHSHNDYLRQRPLFDAIESGFCSVEVDLFLVEDQILVGHTLGETQPNRTLESLYLIPLDKRIRENGGQVHIGYEGTFWVLLDFKAKGAAVYSAFKAALRKYPALAWNPRRPHLRFVASGDRPIESIIADKGQFAAIDGRWPDLEKGYSDQLMPWVSEAWTTRFRWFGQGPFPTESKLELLRMVERTRREGRILRFWGAADSPAVWSLHRGAGVGLLNTDRPTEFAKWWASEAKTAQR